MSACGQAIFRITDGTTTVDLIAPTSGFHLFEWTPLVPDLKEGGVWQDSPLADGRRPAMSRIDNVIESISLKVNGHSQDIVIQDTQNLRRLLKKARDYWTTRAATEPVWIERKAIQETRTSYAVIMNARAPQDDNPFFLPFFPSGKRVNSVLMDEFELLIEREPLWRYEEPGTLTNVALSAVETYNSVSFGNVGSTETRVPTTSDEVYFANKRNVANFTHIFVDDGGVFGANRIGAALPYQLLPAVPATNDAVYFIIDSTVTDSGPFCSVVLDLDGSGADITITWEVWNGAWITIDTSRDNTISLTATGVCAFSFSQVTTGTWATTTVNGVTGWMIRARVSATGAGPVGPQQQNRNPYTVTWPYVELQNTQLIGDWPAKIRLRFRNQSGSGSPTTSSDRIIMGARRVDRGDGFTAYLNISDEQNPSGVTVAAEGANTAFTDDVEESSTGRVGRWTPASTSNTMANRFSITLDNTIAADFHGRFHLYLRTNMGGTGFTVRVRALTYGSTSNQYWESRTKAIEINLAPYPVDMGVVELPPGDADPLETMQSIVFLIQANSTVAGGSFLDFQEIILIPTDEWAAQIEEVANLGATHVIDNNNYVDLDGATYPKYLAYAPVRNRTTGRVEVTWRAVSPVPPQIAPNERIRIWFLACSQNNFGDAVKIAWPFQLHTIQLAAVQRYEGMIGSGTQ